MAQGDGPMVDAMASAPAPGPRGLTAKVRQFLRKHGKRLWWLHSVYALGLGAAVVAFAQKGLEHARWLAVSLSLTWLIVVLFFRVFGSGARQENVDFAHARVRFRFYAMTYALKNMYQGMLFFLLPFYWKSTTLGDPNSWFVGLLAACALLSTIDIVFDRVLMKWRVLASLFHGFTLFGCLNLVIPALFPDTPTRASLLFAAGITVVFFWTLHVPARLLRKKWVLALFVASLAAGIGGVYVARRGIPPVPMHVPYAAVGTQMLKDGRLSMEVTKLHASVIHELICVTDVVVPGGHGDKLHHVWRKDGAEVERWGEETTRVPGTPSGIVRLKSTLQKRDLPAALAGAWSVDVETEDGQLAGRATFRVVD